MNFYELITFLNQFHKRGGLEVFFSGIAGKLASLATSVVVARLLNRADYGLVSYALVIVLAIMPFSGGGMDTSLLRYGAISDSESEKGALFRFTLRSGLLLSFGITGVLLLLSKVICAKQPDALPYFQIFLLLVFGEFLLRMLQAQLRIHMLNRVYALVGFLRAILILALVLSLTPGFGALGYTLALVGAPLMVCFLFARYFWDHTGSQDHWFSSSRSELWRFGLLIGFGAILSRSQFYLDSIMVGNLISDTEALAQYRVACLLPLNLLALPTMFFNSEYVYITKIHADRNFVLQYLCRYEMLALLVCAVMVAATLFFAEEIILLIFGAKYLDSANLLKILVIGLCGAFLLRQPFGNLLNASGKANLNVVNAVLSVVMTVVLLSLLIPKFGTVGAAACTAATLWLSGILGAGMYFTVIFPKLK